MGMYNVANIVADFSSRTMDNLNAVYSLKEKGKCEYEITQAVNSLLGLLLFPYESFSNINNNVLMAEPSIAQEYLWLTNFINRLWADKRLYYSNKKRINVRQFIRSLRNAVAHSGKDDNLMFYPLSSSDNNIEFIIFHSGFAKQGDEFVAKIKCVDDANGNELLELIKCISEMYSKYESVLTGKTYTDYEKAIKKYEQLLT